MRCNGWRIYYAAFGCSISRTLRVLVCGEQVTRLTESNRFGPSHPDLQARNMRLLYLLSLPKGMPRRLQP